MHTKSNLGLAFSLLCVVFIDCLSWRGLELTAADAEGWVSFRNSPDAPGLAQGKINLPLELLWKFKTQGPVEASPVVSNNVVFIGSWDRKLYLLDAQTGKKISDYGFSGSISSTPCVKNEILYCAADGRDNRVLAMNLKDGKTLWQRKIEEHVSSLLVWNDKIYFGSSAGYVVALDRFSGGVAWQFKCGDMIRSSPVIHDGILYIGSLDSYFYALNAEDGSVKWKYRTQASISSSATVCDSAVYFGSLDGHLYALDARSGNLIWKFKTEAGIHSSPTAVNGFVYFGSNDYCMYALEASSGAVVWRFQTGGLIHSSPLIAEDKIFFGSLDHNFYLLDRASGELLWRYGSEGMVLSSPAYWRGKLYIASGDGNLYCFGV